MNAHFRPRFRTPWQTNEDFMIDQRVETAYQSLDNQQQEQHGMGL
jgi:hypothetical protein